MEPEGQGEKKHPVAHAVEHPAPHTDGHDRGSIADHPEDVRPLGESHAPLTSGEKRALFILVVGLAVTVIAIPVLSAMSLSPVLNVLLGLSALLLICIIDIILVTNHYKPVVLWPVLVLVHVVAIGALFLLNPLLPTQLNVPHVMVLSFLVGLIITVVAFVMDVPGKVHRTPPPLEFSVEKLPEFVHAIEDKAKALNFAIGRVYRTSNGGTTALREKLRIPREWYNEFTSAEEHERTERARILVRKIHDRLLLYGKKESEVFSPDELKRLKNVARKKEGGSTVLDVLKENDSDPVELCYRSIMETCEKILEGLG